MSRMPTAGTERQLVGMLRAAHGRLWDAHLCVLYPGFELADEVAEFMPVTQLPFRRGTDPRRPVALRRLAHAIAADVVHPSLWGAGWLTRTSLVGPRRPPIVLSERRVEDFRPAWTRRVDAALRPLTDAWIGNSEDVVDFIRRAHGAPADRVTCVRNGIDERVFHPSTEARAPGGPRIGAVGRLVPEKSFDVLIAALPDVVEACPGATVRIAGEGPERASLIAGGAGLPVELVGLQSTPASVADFMRSLDVFVLPSSFEGLPNVVLEAQACGIPVVVSDVPGMREAAGPAARMVPPRDPGALAAAIIATLQDEKAPATVPTQTFDEVARQHLAVFHVARDRRSARG
jgi:glycosyltransferase involved in cell wall biosynthesis